MLLDTCNVRRDSCGMSNPAKHPPSDSPGTWLTRQMERRSISVRSLAEALGVTGKTIYDWRDDRTAISEARVPLLAEVLDVTELEARRGLGYWVPDETGPLPARFDTEDLDAVEELLRTALEELNRLKREREKPA